MAQQECKLLKNVHDMSINSITFIFIIKLLKVTLRLANAHFNYGNAGKVMKDLSES